MNRRQFFRNLTLTAAGLYIPTKTIFLPPKGGWLCNTLYGDGVHDDADGLQAFLSGKTVFYNDGSKANNTLRNGVYLMSRPVNSEKLSDFDCNRSFGQAVVTFDEFYEPAFGSGVENWT